MALIFLRIQNLRNLRHVEIEPSNGLNILLGQNGAGKTSVLEAVHILGRGRSFRGDRAGPLITNGEDALEVFGRIGYESGGVQNVGVRKARRGMEVRVDGTGIRQLSILARNLPQMVMTPRSHEILERGPEYRRRFMDWGVFHVEHGFLQAMKNYKRVLRQRNMALKMVGQDAGVWNRELIKNGMQIDNYRYQYIEDLKGKFAKVVGAFLPNREITLSYAVTAESEPAYLERLILQGEEERRRGFTQVGPHRADLRIRFEGKDADKTASRGEQKLLISALFLAQAEMLSEAGYKKPILLIDDLPAELDSINRDLFINAISALKAQVFITGTEDRLFGCLDEARLFHVEHGGVTCS